MNRNKWHLSENIFSEIFLWNRWVRIFQNGLTGNDWPRIIITPIFSGFTPSYLDIRVLDIFGQSYSPLASSLLNNRKPFFNTLNIQFNPTFDFKGFFSSRFVFSEIFWLPNFRICVDDHGDINIVINISSSYFFGKSPNFHSHWSPNFQKFEIRHKIISS